MDAKFKLGQSVKLNIRYGFKREPKWIFTTIDEVILFELYKTLLREPMYRTLRGIFTESAFKRIDE